MRLLNYRWFYLFLVLFSSPSFSQDYYWQYSDNNTWNWGQFPNPQAACDHFKSKYPSVTSISARATSDTSGVCSYYFNNGSQVVGPFEDIPVRRIGEGCTPPSIYNPDTKSCEQPPPDLCADKAGSSFPFTKSNNSADNYVTVVNGYGIPNTEACYGGCAASTTDQKCTIKTSGAYRCSGTAYYTGSKCTTAPDVDFTDQQPRPEPESTSQETPCQYIQGPDGVLRCDSEFTTQKEGQYCGEVNGVKTCVDAKPTKDGVNIKTEVKTQTNPDGSTTTTKTDTATHTKCTGVNECKSTTTTTTTVIKKDGAGNTTSVSGSCSGPACPDKNTNPDGDGDGYGDCVTGDCSGEGGGSGEGWYDSKDDTYASVLGDFRDRVAALPVVTGITSFLTFNPSGSCPGETINAWVFTIQLDQWCGNQIPWNFIAAIILGVAAIMSFRIAFL